MSSKKQFGRFRWSAYACLYLSAFFVGCSSSTAPSGPPGQSNSIKSYTFENIVVDYQNTTLQDTTINYVVTGSNLSYGGRSGVTSIKTDSLTGYYLAESNNDFSWYRSYQLVAYGGTPFQSHWTKYPLSSSSLAPMQIYRIDTSYVPPGAGGMTVRIVNSDSITIIGHANIQVGSETFDAIKFEERSMDSLYYFVDNEFRPVQAVPLVTTKWYAPQLQFFVKQESVNLFGTRSTSTMKSYTK